MLETLKEGRVGCSTITGLLLRAVCVVRGSELTVFLGDILSQSRICIEMYTVRNFPGFWTPELSISLVRTNQTARIIPQGFRGVSTTKGLTKTRVMVNVATVSCSRLAIIFAFVSGRYVYCRER